MIEKSISCKILDELFSAIEIIGAEKTIQTLKDAKNSIVKPKMDFDYIVDYISEITAVDKERIFLGNDRNDDRKLALALSVHFVKSEYNLTFTALEKVFQKDAAGMYRYNQLIENLPKNPKTDFDKKACSYVKKIKQFLNREKLKNE